MLPKEFSFGFLPDFALLVVTLSEFLGKDSAVATVVDLV
jgi:hypothetical protein